MRLFHERMSVGERAVHRVDVGVVRNVIAVIASRRRVEGQQPDRVDAKVLQVGELFEQPAKVAAAVAVAVLESAHVQLVDQRVLVPERIVVEPKGLDLPPFRSRLYHKKYSKSCSLRRRRRKRKICAGIACGLISTKLRGPFHR